MTAPAPVASGAAQWSPDPAQPRPTRSGVGLGLLLGGVLAVLVLSSFGSGLLAGLSGLLVLGFVMAYQRSASRIDDLERRLTALETDALTEPAADEPAGSPASVAPAIPASAPEPAPVAASMAIGSPEPIPATSWQPPSTPSFLDSVVMKLRNSSSAELEELVAGRVLPIVGGIALVVAAIFFLGLAFSRGWIGEEGRVLIGLAAGSATYGLGVALMLRGQPLIGHILTGVGLGVVSLALFAATQLYGLVPAELGILAALVADLVTAALAVRVRSQVLAGLGLVTILAAPPLTGASPSVITVLFLGAALVATTVIAVAQGWRWLPGLAFVLSAPQLASYVIGQPDPVQAVPVLLGYGVLNAVAAAGEEWRTLKHDLSPSSATLLTASGAFVVWGLLVALDGAAAAWEGPLVATVGVGYLALGTSFLYRGGDRHPFGLLAFGSGIAAVTLAVPIQLGGSPVPMIWSAEALALTWVYVSRRHPLSGLGAGILGLLAIGHLMVVEYPLSAVGSTPEGVPFADGSGLALAWTLAVGVAAIVLLRTSIERSYVAAGLLALVAWALPHEFEGVTLVWTYALLAVVASAARWRWLRVRSEDVFPLVWQAKGLAPRALEAVMVAAAVVAYGVTLTTLPIEDIPFIGGGTLPATPFTDAATGMVLGLVVGGLASGWLAEAVTWRATAVVLAAGTVAFLLPFEVQPAAVVIGWCLLSAAVLGVARVIVPHRAVARAADGLGGLAIALWILTVLPPTALLAGTDPQTPVLNGGTVAGVAVIALLLVRRWVEAEPRLRLGLAAGAGIAAVHLVSVAVIDVVEQVAGPSVSAADLSYAGQVALSGCWAVLGVGTLVAGLILRNLPIRVFGLALLGVATIKVFVVDLAAVDIAFRVLSFVGLGVLLIGAGWIYLRLQARAAPSVAGGDRPEA